MRRLNIPWQYLLTLLSAIPAMFANWRQFFGWAKEQAGPAIVYPDTGFQGSRMEVRIEDPTADFYQTSAVFFVPVTGITVNSWRPGSNTILVVDITIAANAPAGPRDMVAVPGGPLPSVGTFTVALRPAEVIFISPSGGAQGDIFPVRVYGQNTHFTNASRVTFSDPGVTASNISAVNATELNATLSVSLSAVARSCDAFVTTGDEVAFGANQFLVILASEKSVILREAINTYVRQNHITDPIIVDICEEFIEAVNEGLRQQQVYHTATGVVVAVGVET